MESFWIRIGGFYNLVGKNRKLSELDNGVSKQQSTKGVLSNRFKNVWNLEKR
jgi:hypothetical protein